MTQQMTRDKLTLDTRLDT